jgi:hypothetical protein
MAVTVAGILIFLLWGGVLAAAIVSKVAYILVFVAAGNFYWHATGLKWQAFLQGMPTSERCCGVS